MARLECNSMVQMDVRLDALFDSTDSVEPSGGATPDVGSEGGNGANFFLNAVSRPDRIADYGNDTICRSPTVCCRSPDAFVIHCEA